MTIDEVDEARQALIAAGTYPSIEATRRRLGRGSRRDVGRLLRELAQAAPVVLPAPAPAPAPLPAPVAAPAGDPVGQAQAALAEADARFAEARDALVQAKLTLLATRNLAVEGVLHGTLHPADELHGHALDDVQGCKRTYDEAWQAREDARRQLAKLEQEHRRVHQEAWVQTHRPELVATLEHWRDKLRTAPTDHDLAHAKKESQWAQHAWQQAVAQAPYNGTPPPERS